MGDSEFSSVHWDSPPPTASLPDPSDSNHLHNNTGLLPTSPPATTVPPEMDPLQAPPTNEHTLICVSYPHCGETDVDRVVAAEGSRWDERCVCFVSCYYGGNYTLQI